MPYFKKAHVGDSDRNYCYRRVFSLVDAYVKVYAPDAIVDRKLVDFTISKVIENKLSSTNFKSGFKFVYPVNDLTKQLKKFGAMVYSRVKRDLPYLEYLPEQVLVNESNLSRLRVRWDRNPNWLTIYNLPNTNSTFRYIRLLNHYLLRENLGFTLAADVIHSMPGNDVVAKVRVTCVEADTFTNGSVNGRKLLGMYRMFFFIPQILKVINTLVRKAVL